MAGLAQINPKTVTKTPKRAFRTLPKVYAAGGVGTLLVLLILFLLIGVPNLVEARKNGNETGAIGALHTIGAAQSLFREADKENDGNLDYATLAELGAAGLIDEVLASGTKDGYVFEASYGAFTSEFIWFATARPVDPGVTGDRYFATNHEGVTFYTSGASFRLNTVNCTIPQEGRPGG